MLWEYWRQSSSEASIGMTSNVHGEGRAPLLRASLSTVGLGCMAKHTRRDEPCDDAGEHHTNCKEQPAITPPCGTERGILRRDVDHVRSAIRDVGKYREDEQALS